MADPTVTVENGVLNVSIPMHEPTLSDSGKNKLVATSHGAIKTTIKVDGKILRVNLNAYISAKANQD
jgi:hypothetical protein